MLELQNEGINLKDYRTGTQKSTCPKCSHARKNKSEPCLSVTIEYDKAIWNCHNCGFSGSTTQRKIKTIPFNYVAPTNEVMNWFAKRGIPKAIVDRNRISFGEHFIPAKGKSVACIKYPFIRDGNIINVKYRTLDKHFAQEKDAEKIYFGLDDIKDATTVLICEGENDKLALEVAGYLNVISVPDGAVNRLKIDDIEPSQDVKFSYVWNCWKELEGKDIIIAVDNDAPGDALAEELARRYGKDRCSRVKWSLKDANETLLEQGVDNVIHYIESAVPYPVKGLFPADSLFNEALQFYDNGAQSGVSTGWSWLDNFMTIRTGELSVVTGVPNSGKSEFVDALMVNIAVKHDWNFAICSFENPSRIHLGKLCEKYIGKSFDSSSQNRMTKGEYVDALTGWAHKHFSFIMADGVDDTPDIDWILDRAKIAVARYGIRGLVIDPYNEIEHNRPSNMTETEYVSWMLRKVKKFAQMYGVHVWFIAHPAKMYKDKDGAIPVPSLYDIAGSANWVNKADIGVVVHRPEPENIYGNTEIYIRKVRFKENGRIGMCNLSYDRETGRYSKP